MSLVTLSRCAQQTLKLLKLDFCVGALFEQIIIMICTDFSEYSEPLESANRTPCMQTSCGIIKGAKKSTLSSTISFHSEAV